MSVARPFFVRHRSACLMSSRLVPPVILGLVPRIHQAARTFLEAGWILGLKPRMTEFRLLHQPRIVAAGADELHTEGKPIDEVNNI
ncbi:hypothetical protein HYPP_03574 [Hyphomicrobium sp. ghe19]|nr:hypothetical protein HYPP_03574 [Hyphomicrobium sp. ghe19]